MRTGPIQVSQGAIAVARIRPQSGAVEVWAHVVGRRLDGPIEILEPTLELPKHGKTAATIRICLGVTRVGLDGLVEVGDGVAALARGRQATALQEGIAALSGAGGGAEVSCFAGALASAPRRLAVTNCCDGSVLDNPLPSTDRATWFTYPPCRHRSITLPRAASVHSQVPSFPGSCTMCHQDGMSRRPW